MAVGWTRNSQSVSPAFYPHVWALHLFSSIQTFGVFPSTVKEKSILYFLHLATVGSDQMCQILNNGYFEPTSKLLKNYFGHI